ncbi:MAG: peptide-binding protein [Bacillota bacterium]|nr:peptide-binding protein [Bacillota bacterium]MDW7683859.1 peptide-binding protein [Bacillota bacterium]
MVAGVTASCGTSEPPAEQQKPLVWGMLTDIETLNPVLSESSNETDIMNGIFSTLLKVNEDLEFVPHLLAELPEQSEDGLEYTFKLREGITFHDGVELTADDVKFTIDMKLAEKNAVPSRLMWEKIADFEKIDDYNFKITLTELDVTWLEGWAYSEGMIVPKHILEEEFNAGGEELTKGGEFSRNPVGSGPYKFVEWVTNEYIMLEAYDDFFLGKPEIEKIVYKVIPDTNTMFAQFQSGEIDIYDRAQPNQYKELLALKDQGMDIEVHNFPSFIYMHADFNLRLPVFQDKAVRQALNYAFPKQDFIDTVLDGVGTVAHSDTPPMSWAYNPNVKQYEYNPEKAVEILEEAGWVLNDDGVREKDGVKLEFTMSTNSGNQIREDFQEIAKQNWEAIGASVEIQNYEGATLFGDILENMSFDMIIFAWVSGFDPNAETLWHSKQQPDKYGTGQNYVGLENDRLDELIEAGLKETDKEKRIEIYHEVQEILSEEVPYIFVYFYNTVTAVPGNLENFKPNPTQANSTWNIYEWKRN